jgi:hypothetical protein
MLPQLAITEERWKEWKEESSRRTFIIVCIDNNGGQFEPSTCRYGLLMYHCASKLYRKRWK